MGAVGRGDRAGVYLYHAQSGNGRSEIGYGFFRHQLEDDKNIASVNIEGAKVYGEFKKAAARSRRQAGLQRQLPAAEQEVRHRPAADGACTIRR